MVRKIAVGQSGGPTPVHNDSLSGVIYEAQKIGLEIIGFRNGLEGGGLNSEVFGNLIDLSRIDPFLFRGRPGALLGTTRLKIKNPAYIKEIENNLSANGIEAVVYIGGNDSACTLKNMKNGIHVEKTEDNDLAENDHTSGWGSACLGNSEIIRKLESDLCSFNPRINIHKRTVYSNSSVIIYQVQGRATGWLTYGCAFAKINHAGDIIESAAPHLFLIKEIPYNKEELLGKVDGLLRKNGFAFIVCGEELVNESGETLAKANQKYEREDSYGHEQHSRSGSFNYADFIASEIKKSLGVNASSKKEYLELKETPITPHHIQRCLTRSLVDADEAFNAGREAVKAVCDGDFGKSIALKRISNCYNIKPVRVPLENVAEKTRKVDDKYIGSMEGPTQKFYEDFLPLIGGPLAMTHYHNPICNAI